MTTLKFYEKVIVVESAKSPELVGQTGYVLGISEEDGVIYGYAVSFLGRIESRFFQPGELRSTGEFGERSLFYDDNDPTSRIRVRVVDGKGEIIE